MLGMYERHTHLDSMASTSSSPTTTLPLALHPLERPPPAAAEACYCRLAAWIICRRA